MAVSEAAHAEYQLGAIVAHGPTNGTELLAAIERLAVHPDWSSAMDLVFDLRDARPLATSSRKFQDLFEAYSRQVGGTGVLVVDNGDEKMVRELLRAQASTGLAPTHVVPSVERAREILGRDLPSLIS